MVAEVIISTVAKIVKIISVYFFFIKKTLNNSHQTQYSRGEQSRKNTV